MLRPFYGMSIVIRLIEGVFPLERQAYSAIFTYRTNNQGTQPGVVDITRSFCFSNSTQLSNNARCFAGITFHALAVRTTCPILCYPDDWATEGLPDRSVIVGRLGHRSVHKVLGIEISLPLVRGNEAT